MEIKYTLYFSPKVIKDDFPRLDPVVRKEIRDVVRQKLTTAPDVYGKPLQQDLKGCRRLRVGDYRVVFQIQKKQVHVLAIIHRSSNYKGVGKRI